ncbi:MAG: hypothetical protein Q9210_006453, partial [Variospora velana]
MNQSSTAVQVQPVQLEHDRRTELVATGGFLIVATFLAVAIRFWAQRTISKHWEVDNIVIYIATYRRYVQIVSTDQVDYYSSERPDGALAFTNGMGKHLADVMANDSHKPRQMLRIFKASQTICVYVVGVLQSPCLGLVKISILFFYRRVFTMRNRFFRYALYILGAYTALLTVATWVVAIVRCQPIHYFWDQAYLIEGVQQPYAVKGHCLKPRSQVLGFLLTNTLSDVAVLILPALGLWNLQLSRAKKIGLFGRRSLLYDLNPPPPPTPVPLSARAPILHCAPGVNADLTLWTAVECCIGTICASLPAMAALRRRSGSGSTIRLSTVWSK